MIKYILPLVYLLAQSVYCQNRMEFGQWKNHLNLRECSSITQSENDIIVSTGKSLILIDKDDLSKREFSRIDGLNETKISIVKYDKFNKQLFVIYTSGAIDIVGEDFIEYDPSIKNNKSIAGDRTITDIHIVDDKSLFLTSSFGIMEFNTKKLEFKSTTFTNVKAFAVTSDAAYIYAALQDGLYRIAKSNKNKENFSNWEFLGNAFALPAIYECTNVETFNNGVFAVINDEVYSNTKGDGKFEKINIDKPNNFKIQWMSSEGKHLIIGLRDNNVSSNTRYINEKLIVEKGGGDCINRTLYGIEDEKQRVWYADEWRQIRYTNTLKDGCNRLEFDSPYSFESNHIEVADERVFFASSGATDNFQLNFGRAGAYILNKDGSWSNINEEFKLAMRDKDFLGLHTIAPHPKNKNIFYAGSYYYGAMEYNIAEDKAKFYGDSDTPTRIKSSLQTVVGAPTQIRVFHMEFDKDGNLWMSNTGAPKPISVLTKEGNWHSFAVNGNTFLSKMAIDQSNNKWFCTFGSGVSIHVFNDNNTPADPSDDKIKTLNSANTVITSQPNCLAVDLDGDVWVGTLNGPIVFECDPFEKSCVGSRRKVLQDSIPALLLETEEIFSIEVDGANRKWFGTRNGIFVQSPDGGDQIYHFTETNSPLMSNRIVDMDFDGKTGLMYISTDLGIQSYQTETLAGGKRNSPSAYAFPNPVGPDFTGEIAIKGLARDADVRITDINGKLVYKTKANGGLALWDGRDYNGEKVDTGVYLVFSANDNDLTTKDTVVTKIAVVK